MTQLTNCLVVWISEVKKWQKKTLRWSYKYISRIHKIRNFVLKVVNPWKFKMSWFSKVSLIHARTFSGTALFWANRARKAPLRCWRRCFLAARSSSSSMISAVAGPILLFLSINHFRCLGIIKNKYCSLCDTPEKRCHISVLIFFVVFPWDFYLGTPKATYGLVKSLQISAFNLLKWGWFLKKSESYLSSFASLELQKSMLLLMPYLDRLLGWRMPIKQREHWTTVVVCARRITCQRFTLTVITHV